MLELSSDRWTELRDAYGPATSLPEVFLDTAGSISNEDPYDLWGRLCHQGDVFTASYACVPHLLRMIVEQGGNAWSAISLIACIEAARLLGRGPAIPADLKIPYNNAIRSLPCVLSTRLNEDAGEEMSRAVLAALAVACSQGKIASALLTLTAEEFGEILES